MIQPSVLCPSTRRSPRSRPAAWLVATVAVTATALCASAACDRKAIPERPADLEAAARRAVEGAAAGERDRLQAWLEGGELVFEDAFDREAIGDSWKSTHTGWTIVDGAVHSKAARNEGLWLAREIPTQARIQFTARSEPAKGKPFVGDLKCEVFAETPSHEGGYIVINGGWSNRLDVVARKDEHGTDRLEQPSRKVEPSKAHHYTVLRGDRLLYVYRDGELVMTYDDPEPVMGRYFGFNNWESLAYYDDLKVYDLTGL